MAGIRDITTPKQRAVAVSFISWAYGAGFFIGPLIGAYLAHPAALMPSLCGTVLEAYPYLLPCLVVAGIILLTSSLLICLPTKPPAKPAARTSSTISPAASSVAEADVASTAPVEGAVNPPATASEGDGRRLLGASSSSSSSSAPAASAEQHASKAGVAAWAACRRALAKPIVLLLCAYLFCNFGAFGVNETYPLYVSRNDSSGLGLTPNELATTMLPQGVTIMVMPFAYPLIADRFGHKGAAYAGIGANVVVSAILPAVRFLPSRSSVQWAALLFLSSLRGTAGPLMFPAMIILINACITERVGYWNGLSQSVGSTARAVAPALFGHLFATGVAEGHAPFPFDVGMPYVVTELVLGGAVCLIACTRVVLDGPPAKRRRRARSWRALVPGWLRR